MLRQFDRANNQKAPVPVKKVLLPLRNKGWWSSVAITQQFLTRMLHELSVGDELGVLGLDGECSLADGVFARVECHAIAKLDFLSKSWAHHFVEVAPLRRAVGRSRNETSL